ncbi:unnamed protein product, partial [Heterosigma akashiwo]
MEKRLYCQTQHLITIVLVVHYHFGKKVNKLIMNLFLFNMNQAPEQTLSLRKTAALRPASGDHPPLLLRFPWLIYGLIRQRQQAGTFPLFPLLSRHRGEERRWRQEHAFAFFPQPPAAAAA